MIGYHLDICKTWNKQLEVLFNVTEYMNIHTIHNLEPRRLVSGWFIVLVLNKCSLLFAIHGFYFRPSSTSWLPSFYSTLQFCFFLVHFVRFFPPFIAYCLVSFIFCKFTTHFSFLFLILLTTGPEFNLVLISTFQFLSIQETPKILPLIPVI